MRKAIKFTLAKAIPTYLVQQVANELRLATRRMFTARSLRRRLGSQRCIRVNIGCGRNPTPGWINLDVIPHPGVYFWDCRSGLPFSDGAVAAIYSEHFVEHLDLESEARPFLRECLRCLQPGGVLRIVVPDAGAYLRAYSGPWETLAKMQFMNAIFRQGYEHKYAYDDETLILILRETGFPHVVVQQFGTSIDLKMAPDSDDRRTESLYVEAVKG